MLLAQLAAEPSFWSHAELCKYTGACVHHGASKACSIFVLHLAVGTACHPLASSWHLQFSVLLTPIIEH